MNEYTVKISTDESLENYDSVDDLLHDLLEGRTGGTVTLESAKPTTTAKNPFLWIKKRYCG